MFGIGGAELLIIFVFALLFIGPKKLPELARGLGKGIREFQKAKDDLLDQVNAPAETKDNTQNLASSDAPSETITTSEDNKKSSDDSNA
ncbi:putative secreted protein [Halobacteriovorax marinus SJ]|uniref:Sec-independent protein translocase protein TatA n=1 Tax=Halobacteriovorax marinus (strain ATCC BAA-682 / DSM 15412 / SJ) TaxID=862908 RepID=E1X0T5_HALMS|nr:twin-arginine translocase TatA/TatE family subunit [Halobacteriovorax marinus]CBW26423.1 putative secreted protein [Halobacteriovorax marinus SJ]